MRHVRPLDGFRGLAVLLVIVYHYGYTEFGWAGVQLFFVLSGFLITSILLEERSRPIGEYLRRFYYRRILRIFPVFYGYLALLLALALLTGHPPGFGRVAPFLLSYVYNLAAPFFPSSEYYTHFWSLCVEEQFYLLWPLLVFFTRGRRLLFFLGGLLLFSPLFRFGMGELLREMAYRSEISMGGVIYYNPVSQFDGFAAGALVAVLGVGAASKWPARLFAATSGLLLLAGALNFTAIKGGFELLGFVQDLGFQAQRMVHGQHVWGYTVINLFSAACIACLVQGKFSWFFEARWLTALGKVSYGAYVFHLPLVQLLRDLHVVPQGPGARLAFFPIYFALVFGISWLSYRFFESRFLALKDREPWKQRQNQAAAAEGVGS